MIVPVTFALRTGDPYTREAELFAILADGVGRRLVEHGTRSNQKGLRAAHPRHAHCASGRLEPKRGCVDGDLGVTSASVSVRLSSLKRGSSKANSPASASPTTVPAP